jgi:hypothetical protein
MIAARMRYNPEANQTTKEESRQVGAGEPTARPNAKPNITNIRKSAVVRRAPTKIAPQEPVYFVSIKASSAQTKKRQDRKQDHDKTDEPNDAVHINLPALPTI